MSKNRAGIIDNLAAHNKHIRSQARIALAQYVEQFPEEKQGLKQLRLLMENDGAESIVSRSNMAGHITCSAFVIDFKLGKILLIDHLTLQRLLQPGGHIEMDLALWIAAMREAREETGVRGLELKGWGGVLTCPFDVDIHEIPANPKKDEGIHHHFDFAYLFSGDSTLPLTHQQEEVTMAEWRDLRCLPCTSDDRYHRIVRKLADLKLVSADLLGKD